LGQLENGQRSEANPIRVGELLVEAGVVSSAEMTEAIQVSKRLGMPIGRILTMMGCVRESVLEAALQVQQLLRHNEVPLTAAVNSLQRVHEMNMSITEALAEEDLKPDLEHDPHKLAELLVDSNIVSAEQMEKAVQASFDQGVPLGNTLVMQGFLSEAVLPSLVRIQRQITDGQLDREDGLKVIQETFVLWIKADESLKKPLEVDEPVARQRPVQQQAAAVVHHPADHIKEAAEPTSPNQSAQSAGHQTVQSQPVGAIEEKSAAEDHGNLRLVDLLKQSGLFSQADVQRRYDLMLKDPQRSARFFLELGLIDESDIKNALRTHSLMQRGMLTKEEATQALKDSHTDNLGFSHSTESSEKVKRYMDKDKRGQMSKVLGGALLGALVAGFTISKRK